MKVENVKMKKTFDVLEKIRVHLEKEKMQAPGVVVVGSQSAGKSSVLESICGISFPRGNDMVTRVPMILRLESDPSVEGIKIIISPSDDLEKDGKEIEIGEVPVQIDQLTNEIAGEGDVIVDSPIHLKVIRPEGPNMTIIDLPGITHNTTKEKVAGSVTIHDQTTALVRKYIESPEIIILCVHPAADDIQNCEALALAKIADPKGSRTLGVLTKTDMIGKDSKVIDTVQGKKLPLKLGWIAIKNRGPGEDELTIKQVFQNERQFFETHPELSGLAQQYWGIPELKKRIETIQHAKVEAFLPKIRAELRQRIHAAEKELASLPRGISGDVDRRRISFRALHDVSSSLLDILDGTAECEEQYQIPKCMHALFTEFTAKLKKGSDELLTPEFMNKLVASMKTTKGLTLPNFLSHSVFKKMFCQAMVGPLEIASEELMHSVLDLIKRTLIHLSKNACQTFTGLEQLFVTTIEEFFEKQVQECKKHVQILVRAEKQTMTLDPRYMELIHENSYTDIFASKDFGTYEDDAKEMRLSLYAYTKIVLARISDHIPMIVRMLLIEEVSDELPTYIDEMVNSVSLEDYVQEDVELVEKRESLTASLERLRICDRSLEELRQ